MSDTKLGQGPDSSWSNKGVACFAIVLPPVKKLINYPDFIEIDFLSPKKPVAFTSSQYRFVVYL
jgi:hypothetical protein